MNRLKTILHKIEAIGDFSGNYRPKLTSYGYIDDTNLSQVFKIKVGARVMMVFNVDTSNSIVNGCLGSFLDII